MKRYKNVLLIHLQAIVLQYLSFFSVHSLGYELQKELHLEDQALTTHFNIPF
jgi:hypothetical protein